MGTHSHARTRKYMLHTRARMPGTHKTTHAPLCAGMLLVNSAAYLSTHARLTV